MSDLDDDGFDWVESEQTSSSDSGELSREDLLHAVERLRKENARLKQEKEHARNEYEGLHKQHNQTLEAQDDAASERDALKEKLEEVKAERDRLRERAEQADALEELQDDVLEMYSMLSNEYDHGVPRQMLIGTVQECCDATGESVEHAIRGLMNTGKLVENQQHIYRPDDVDKAIY